MGRQRLRRQELKGLRYENMAGAAGQIYCTECSFIVLIDVCRFEQGYTYKENILPVS